MNRAERRARMKKMRMKVLRGGKRQEAPQVDTSQPDGLLAKKLDGFVRDQCVADPRLNQITVLQVFLQMSAGLAVELGAPAEEVCMALETFVEREKVARKQSPEPRG